MSGGHLQIVVCGAGPAEDISKLIEVAHERSWTTAAIATVSALDFINVREIEDLAGNPVRVSYETSGIGRRVLPSVDAVIIAPATYNTINKLALGIADTYPLTSVAELIGRGVPTLIVPFVNAALAGRKPFQRSIAVLRAEGVRVLSGPDDGWEPYAPGTGADKKAVFPWRTAFQIAEEMAEWRLHS